MLALVATLSLVPASAALAGPAAAGAKSAKKPAAPAPQRGPKGPAKTKGSATSNKAPRKAGSAPTPPDAGLRASIAGEEPTSGKAEDSPELDAIKEVDDVLFPELHAAATNTGAYQSLGGGKVVSTGLPPKAELGSTPLETATDTTDFSWLTKLDKPDLPFRWDPRLVRYLDYFKNNPKGRSMVSALIKRAVGSRRRFSGPFARRTFRKIWSGSRSSRAG